MTYISMKLNRVLYLFEKDYGADSSLCCNCKQLAPSANECSRFLCFNLGFFVVINVAGIRSLHSQTYLSDHLSSDHLQCQVIPKFSTHYLSNDEW